VTRHPEYDRGEIDQLERKYTPEHLESLVCGCERCAFLEAVIRKAHRDVQWFIDIATGASPPAAFKTPRVRWVGRGRR
jgi:hypothetical protein